MPLTRSSAKAAASPPESAAAGGPQRTPAPSPSTSLRLGIGPAYPDDDAGSLLDLKPPAAAAPPRHCLRLAGAALRLGLGPSSPDDDDDLEAKPPSLTPPAAAATPPPLRRSLRLAGAAAAAAGSPNTPSARGGSSSVSVSVTVTGSGSGSGSGKRAGRPRTRAPASSLATTVSPRTGNSSSDVVGSAAGDAALASGDGSGGSGPFTTLRSSSRIAKRRMAQAGGEAVGVGSSARRGQVHDEMPHRDVDVGTPAKRCKTVLVGGVKTEYVSDTDSDCDEDCKMLGPSETKPTPVAMNLDRTEKGGMDHPANAGNGESLQTHNLFGKANGGEYVPDTDSDSDDDCKMLGPSGTKPNPVAMRMDRAENGGMDDPANASNGESLQTHNLLGKANGGGVVEELACPLGSPSSFEAKVSADMYFKGDLSQYSSREEGKVKEKLVLGNNNSRADANVGCAVGTSSRKLSPDSKGKGKMVVEDSLSSLSSIEEKPDFAPVDSKEIQHNSGSVSASKESNRRQAAKERAIRLAPKFAFFKADEDEHSEDDDEEEELEPGPDAEDWPGPFATAARLYEEREAKLRARELNSSKLGKSANRVILWSPSKDRKNPARVQAAPSLTSLCLNMLAQHSECIESLGGIPEELKHKLLKILCHSRKMSTHLLNELLSDSPTELHLSECSWLSEDDFEKTFGKCSTESLQDLQLDISGRCMPDYILPTTLAKLPNCMPLLRKISLKGNYRLSDNGLGTIISAAPALCSLNLCDCSLLTSSGIDILANKLQSVLRELYIDDCTNVDAMAILPALQKINHLEVLSMSGILSVSDKFVKGLIPVQGSNLKELAFAGCLELTSSSIKTIGEHCQGLTSLDLRNLNKLRDSAMKHLRGCRLIRKLKLQRNAFSDEAVSQYLEGSGGCLTELMLNNVKKVGDLTALAISRKCSVLLEALDLSFCRELTDEALGLIVDSCPTLRILKLFGCTQVTDLFLKGHSNTSVNIIGIEGSILVEMDNR